MQKWWAGIGWRKFWRDFRVLEIYETYSYNSLALRGGDKGKVRKFSSKSVEKRSSSSIGRSVSTVPPPVAKHPSSETKQSINPSKKKRRDLAKFNLAWFVGLVNDRGVVTG
jgi:hypothetical protein